MKAKYILKFGLKQKIGLSIFIISLGMILFVGGLTNFLYEKFYVEKQIETIFLRATFLEELYYTEPRYSFLEKVDWANEYLDCEVIFSDNPMLLSGAAPFELGLEENLISFEERQTLLAGEELIIIREHARFNQQILAIVLPLFEEERLEAALFLYRPLSTIYEPFESIQMTIITVLLFLIILLILLTKKITNYVVKPLTDMMLVTKQISDGDFSKKMLVKQEDELGKLADSFNQMTEKLEMEEKKRKEFLANVSHELRTPISYMKNFTEALEEGIIDSSKYQSVIKQESGRLERLVADLLDLAQLEGDSYPMKETILPFAQLIEDMSDRFFLEAEKKNITLMKDLDEEIIVLGDEDRLVQVLSNLLANSLKYTKSGGTIKLILTKNGSYAYLSIEDNGEGIPSEDIPKLTDRFYRVDKSRARKEGGTGLGLAIVSQIVKKHHGEMYIQSEMKVGTKITIKLPLYEENRTVQ